jgi:DNA repair exonuclease SbcCD ATPase subunit
MSGTSPESTSDVDEREEVETEEVEETSDESGKSTKKTYTEDDYKSLDARMRAADQNRSKTQRALEEAQAKLAEIEKSKLSELERAKAEAEELKARTEALTKRLKDQALENAFLATAGVEWADKEDAYTVLRNKFLDGVEVDEDGKVTGMAEAVKTMAKAKPHLIKSTTEEVTPSSEATGKTPVKRKGEKDTPDRESLRKRFPALGK